MPDITMCSNQECPKRLDCFRFMAIPSEYMQAFFHPDPTAEGCEYFWSTEGISTLRLKERE